MNCRHRTKYLVAIVLSLPLFMSHVASSFAQNFNLSSLFSVNASLGLLPGFSPSINNFGDVAYSRRVFDTVDNRNELIVMIHDGNSEAAFFNVTETFGGSATLNASVVINDNRDVAVKVDAPSATSPCSNNVHSCVVRINENKTVTILATAKGVGGGGDFAEFEQWLSMNNSGHIAIRVRRETDGTNQVVRLEGSSVFTVMATQSADLILTSQPSINDSGTVAFVAQVPNTIDCPGPSSCIMIFTSTDGTLSSEGRRPPSGNSSHAPIINNNGLVLDTGVGIPTLIYTAQGGTINTLVVGNEDPVFTTISSFASPGQNDFGDFVFGSQKSGFPGDFGLFTGNDPVLHKVVRKGDTVFGGPVSAESTSIRTGLHHINNLGQIVFALMVDVSGPNSSVTSHIVRADPIRRQLTVTNTSDSGPGSLRQAILDSRGDGPTTITFDPNIMPATINVLSTLPSLIDRGDTIDGAGEITLNGVGLTTMSDHGLRIRASNVTITGLTVQNFGGSGIRIQSDPTAPDPSSDQVLTGIIVSNNAVAKNLDGIVLAGGQTNNRFEVTITGNTLTQNSSDGIVVNGSDNTGAGGNVIDVIISNNSINGSAGNDSALAGDGIRVTGGLGTNVGNNVITALISDNLSRKNADEGIRIAGAGTGSSSSDNRIDATITGNISQSNGIPNGGNGITVSGGPTITVPATTSGNQVTFLADSNQSSNNTGNGIGIQGNAGSSHVVRGTISNNEFSGNSEFGIFLHGRGSFNTLDNIDIQFNQITRNGDRGLVIFGGDTTNTDNAKITSVLVNGNTVGNNGHHGIVADLGTGVGNFISFAGITDNVSSNNGAHGIIIAGGIDGNGASISGNRADRNRSPNRDGININSTGYVLTGNRAEGNARFGISASGNTDGGGNISRRICATL